MENKFFIHDGALQKGPYSIEELKSLNLTKESMVWCEGMDTWKPAGEIEELDSVFPVTPPPMEPKTNMPPPFIPAAKAENTVKPPLDEKEKKKRLYLIIGGSALLLLLTVALVLIFALPGKEGEKAEKSDSLASVIDSLKPVDINNPQQAQQAGKPNAAGVQSTQKPSDVKVVAEDREEAQRKKYAGSWRSYIYASADFKKVPGPPPMGTMVKNIMVTVHNNCPYYVDEAVVTISFYGSKNEFLNSEKITFKGIPANSKRSLEAPSGKGYSAESRITKITSNSMKLYQ
jgi:hypothetical protein